MDETTLINDTWVELQRLSDSDRTTARYNRWMKVNLERNQTLLTIDRSMLMAALRRSSLKEIVWLYPDLDERTSDW